MAAENNVTQKSEPRLSMQAENGPLSVEDIIGRIRMALHLKGACALAEDPVERDSSVGALTVSEALQFDTELYQNLHQARVLAMNGVNVHYELGWRTPIIGHVWVVVRRLMHQEIRVYLDAAFSQQSNINNYVVRTLSKLIDGFTAVRFMDRLAEVEAQTARMEELAAQIEDLKGRVRDLESQVAESRSSGRS